MPQEWKPPDFAVQPEEDKGILSSIWDFANKPISSIPSQIGDYISEPLLSSGEDTGNKLKTYGGAYIKSLGNIVDSLTSPLNLGLTALSGGSNMAARYGLPEAAQALEIPGQIASGGMVAHGGYKTATADNTPDRLAGIVEAVMGGMGMRGRGASEIPESDSFTKANKALDTIDVLNEADNYHPSTILKKLNEVNPDLVKTQTTEWTPPDFAQSVLPEQTAIPEQVNLSPIDKLKQAIQAGEVQRPQQELMQSKERAQRIQSADEVDTPGMKGYYEQLGKLSGEYPKVELPKTLEQADVDSLLDEITKNEMIRPFQKINAKTGLIKLLNGQLPQKNEIALLDKVFGGDIGQLIELHGGFGAIGGNRQLINDAVNIPKSLMATADLSAPLRQGLPLIHRPEYWKAFKDMFGQYGDEATFQASQEALAERPNAELGNKSGLFLANVGEDLTQREESFLSNSAEKIPLLGRAVRASDRAYVGFLNQLRANTFDSLVKQAQAMGHEPYVSRMGSGGRRIDTINPVYKEIANYVNTASGRGSLGRFEKNAVELNALLFSPRMIASRLTMMNPQYYINASPLVRKEALRSLLSVAAAGLTTAALAKSAGAKVSTDPNSSDFLKSRFGRTRLDPFAGFQQYVVAASRLLTGKYTSASHPEHHDILGTGVLPSRLGLVLGVGNKTNPSMLENKLSPIASFVDTILSGRTYEPGGVGQMVSKDWMGMKGAKGRVSGETINRFIPLIISDLVDIYKSDPSLLPLGILGSLGMGLQTF